MTAVALKAQSIAPNDKKKSPRPYRRRTHRSKMRSHYRFAAWHQGHDSRRIPIEIDFHPTARREAREYILNVQSGYVEKDEWDYITAQITAFGNPEISDLISTSTYNPSEDTESLLFLPFDLDFKRAADAWKKEGVLDWPTIGAFLQEREPVIMQRLTYVAKSSGGQGLAVAFAVSPFEIGRQSSSKIEQMARNLQDRLIRIFNYYGMGADEAAKGLVRWMPNFRDPKRLIDYSSEALSKAQVRRDRVIIELLKATDKHPALAYKKKAEQTDAYLYPKSSLVERKLAALYLFHLEESLDFACQWTCQELIDSFSISEKTLRKILKDPPAWLDVKHIGGREGFKLTLSPTLALTARARELDTKSGATESSLKKKMRELLVHPSLVKDGDRYEWLGNVLWAVKLKGASQGEAIRIVERVAESVPGYEESRALTKNLRASVRTFWTRRLYDEHGNPTIGSRPNLPVPAWLDDAYFLEVGRSTATKEDGKLFDRKVPNRDLNHCLSYSRSFQNHAVLSDNHGSSSAASASPPMSLVNQPEEKQDSPQSKPHPVMGSSERTLKIVDLSGSGVQPEKSLTSTEKIISRPNSEGLPTAQISRPSAKVLSWWNKIGGGDDDPPKTKRKVKV